jgi:hypothetical protein
LGSDWVASIINAVGNAKCVEPAGSQFAGQSPWTDTAIFVVWDDWGGFYDHVGGELTFALNTNFNFGAQYETGSNGQGCLFAPSYGANWGCGYTYGWRVPFLVVSQYTSDGYVSGACKQPGTQGALPVCPNPAPYYVHDFGSILAFIENNFLGSSYVGQINSSQNGGSGYLFADNYYPEQFGSPAGPPLGDFFDLYINSENYNPTLCQSQPGSQGCPKSFEPIQCVVDATPPKKYSGDPSTFCPDYFTGYTGPVEDPDNDVIDND